LRSSSQVQRRNGGVKGQRSSNKNEPSSRRLQGKSGSKKGKGPRHNILQTLANDNSFSDLFELIVRRTLAGALESGGPFTLFVPTNKAFRNLPDGTTDLLFKKDAFLPHLQVFLFNHLINGVLLEEDITDGLVLPTFSGESIRFFINATTGDVFVNNREITHFDEIAINGNVQEIDESPLSPSWVFASLTTRVQQFGQTTSILLSLVVQAGLDFSVSGEFTLLAPTNAAFTSLSPATIECIVAPANLFVLQDILNFHVIKDVLLFSDFEDGEKYKTLEGGKVEAVRTSDPVALSFQGANVVAADVLANNGVVFIIDGVLDPGSICSGL
jgi:transforming growth factor-beta-induced protein